MNFIPPPQVGGPSYTDKALAANEIQMRDKIPPSVNIQDLFSTATPPQRLRSRVGVDYNRETVRSDSVLTSHDVSLTETALPEWYRSTVENRTSRTQPCDRATPNVVECLWGEAVPVGGRFKLRT
jgi:hypothetical protein